MVCRGIGELRRGEEMLCCLGELKRNGFFPAKREKREYNIRVSMTYQLLLYRVYDISIAVVP